jgi:hypothetical protein
MYNGSLELTAPQHTAVKRKDLTSNAVVDEVPSQLPLPPPDHYFSSREHRYPVWPLSLAAELLVLVLPNHFFARSATGCLSAVQTLGLRFNNTTDL